MPLSTETPTSVFSKGYFPRKFMVVVMFHNLPLKKLQRCLSSVQKAASLRDDISLYLYDDASENNFAKAIQDLVEGTGLPYILHRNLLNRKKSHNLYNLAKDTSIPPETILVFLDGDDYLNVSQDPFKVLDVTYKEVSVESTLGSMELDREAPQNTHISNYLSGYPIPPHDFNNIWNPKACWGWYHLKTCYHRILTKVEDTFYTIEDNLTFSPTGDDNFIFPRCVNLSYLTRFIPKVLYIYDTSNDTSHDEGVSRDALVNRLRSKKDYPGMPPRKTLSFSNNKHPQRI